MAYYLSKMVGLEFDEAVGRIREELAKEGFGILTEIDVRETLKKKLYVDVPQYIILGACNPVLAYRALMAEPHIGVLLPCNVILRQGEAGKVEIAAMDPVETIASVLNPAVMNVAVEVRKRLKSAINRIS